MSWIRRERLYAYSRNRSGKCVLFYRNGNEIAADWHNGSSSTEVRQVRSCSKSFTAALIAKMIAMGLIPSWDSLVADVIIEWQGVALKKDITLRHLLTQVSGIAPIGLQTFTYGECIARNASPRAWDYDNVHWQILGEYVRRIVTVAPHNKASPSHALVDWVLTPAGISVDPWLQLSTGQTQPNMASGVQITAPNMVKFGEFLRKGGNGIIPQTLLTDLVTPSATYSAYCMGFWKTKDRMSRIITGAADPSKALEGDDFALLGLGFNCMWIRMDRNEVLLRMGGLQQLGEPDFIEEEFLDLAGRI